MWLAGWRVGYTFHLAMPPWVSVRVSAFELTALAAVPSFLEPISIDAVINIGLVVGLSCVAG
jgi:hypothetical protein